MRTGIIRILASRPALGMLVALLALRVTFPPALSAVSSTSFYFKMAPIPGSADWVAAHEVTQRQYLEITGENPSAFPAPDGPVESVSWDDAVAFCAKLTEREHRAGRLPPDMAYDLPTDAQWDAFAAGATLDGAVISLQSRRACPALCGSLSPTPLGLYDVFGNVWEWCRDWYGNDIRKKDTNKDLPAALTDAQAAAQGPEETFKVLRGGAWDTGPSDGFSAASRLRYAPGMSNYHTGFRCVVIKNSESGGSNRAGATR